MTFKKRGDRVRSFSVYFYRSSDWNEKHSSSPPIPIPLIYKNSQGNCPCKSSLVPPLHTRGILSTRIGSKSIQQLLASISHSRLCRVGVLGTGNTIHPQYKGSEEQGATNSILLICETNLLLAWRKAIPSLEPPPEFSLLAPWFPEQANVKATFSSQCSALFF